MDLAEGPSSTASEARKKLFPLIEQVNQDRTPVEIDDIARDPFDGIGKPEQLRHALAGAWSRRIDEEHRLVYVVEGDDIVILQARYHYG